MADVSLETIKHGPAETGVNDLILKRWSPRAFADKPVSKDDLRKIFTAASWAASSGNEQPWRFLIGVKNDEKSGGTYKRIFDSLVPGNQAWAQSAPVLYATIAKKTFTSNGSPNSWASHDVGSASTTAALQAIDLGIHTHGMAGYDKETLRAFFAIPADFEPVAVWAMGYLGDPESLPDTLKVREKEPRARKDLDEFTFTDWDTPTEF